MCSTSPVTKKVKATTGIYPVPPVLSMGVFGILAYWLVLGGLMKYSVFFFNFVIYGSIFMMMFAAFVNTVLRSMNPGCQKLLTKSEYPNPDDKVCLDSLDKICNKEGINDLWKREVQEKKKEMKILLTGVTGYVGAAVLFQILNEAKKFPRSGKEKLNHKVFVLIRPKLKKNLTAAQRIEKLKEKDIFAAVRDVWDDVVVPVAAGDLTDFNCGVQEDELEMLGRTVTAIVHVAADVNFTRPIAESAAINIAPSLELIALAKKWDTCTRFCHVSTAFVNPGCGTPEKLMAEDLYPLGKYDARDLYESMIGDQKLALKAKAEIKFQNNYVFTKCVAEHLMVRENFSDLRVLRPAVVGPSWMLPVPCWNGDKPSTVSAFMLLWGTRVVRFGHLVDKPMPVIPVDVVAVAVVHAMIAPKEEMREVTIHTDSSRPVIRNLIWSEDSRHFVSTRSMCFSVTQVCADKSLFSTGEIAVSIVLSEITRMFPQLFLILHAIFNLGPLKILEWAVELMKLTGSKFFKDLPVTKLKNFANMVPLYEPFISRRFYFAGTIRIPPEFDVDRYTVMMVRATQNFWESLFPGTIDHYQHIEFLPSGRWDLWWILTQPRNCVMDCIKNFLAIGVFRKLFGTFSTDMTHMDPIMQDFYDRDQGDRKKNCYVFLPNHQSMLDYLIIKHVCFFLRSFGVDVPVVFGDSDLADPKLSQKIGDIKKKYHRNSTLVSFLEETPSADGRIRQPKADFVRSLLESEGDHDYSFIPVMIEYDRNVEFRHNMPNRAVGLWDLMCLYWRVCMMGRSRGTLGACRVSFGQPQSLKDGEDLDSFVKNIQKESLALSGIPEYLHLDVAEEHLKIHKSVLSSALTKVGATVREIPKSFGIVGKLRLDNVVESADEKWFMHMQWIRHFLPYLADTHPKWANWVGCGVVPAKQDIPKSNEIEVVLSILSSILDKAELLATRAKTSLSKQGVDSPTVSDLVVEMSLLDADRGELIALPIAKAAASLFAV